MVGGVRIIFEVTTVRVGASGHRTEPVVGHTDVETTKGICQREVELLGIGWIGESRTAPGCQRQSFVTHAQRRLQCHTTQFLATPDITTYNVSTNRCLYLILCKGGHTHGHTQCE